MGGATFCTNIWRLGLFCSITWRPCDDCSRRRIHWNYSFIFGRNWLKINYKINETQLPKPSKVNRDNSLNEYTTTYLVFHHIWLNRSLSCIQNWYLVSQTNNICRDVGESWRKLETAGIYHRNKNYNLTKRSTPAHIQHSTLTEDGSTITQIADCSNPWATYPCQTSLSGKGY